MVFKAAPQNSIRVARKETAQVCGLLSIKTSGSRRMELASLQAFTYSDSSSQSSYQHHLPKKKGSICSHLDLTCDPSLLTEACHCKWGPPSF